LEELRNPIDQTLHIVFLIVIKQGWVKAADMVHSAVKRTGRRPKNHFFDQTVYHPIEEP
jgi:type IV secretory pathway VirB3-like protein